MLEIRRFRARILRTSMLVMVGSISFNHGAEAACSATAPASGDTVTCSGSSGTPVAAVGGSSDVTVVLDPTASLSVGADDGVTVRDGSFVTLDGTASPAAGAKIYVNSGGDAGHAGIRAAGDGNMIVMKGRSLVNGQGDNDDGIVLDGDGNSVSMIERAYIWAGRDGIAATGDGNKIDLSDNANIVTFYGTGISVDGTGNEITLGDDTYVLTYGFADGQTAIWVQGDDNTVTLNDNAQVENFGEDTTGVFLEGDGNALTLNDGASIVSSDAGATGVHAQGNGNSVTLNDDSFIALNGGGTGILFEGDDNTLSMNDYAAIRSYGSAGFIGVDLEGSGNTLTMGGYASISSFAGSGSAGVLVTGTGNTVTLDAAAIYTASDYAPGIDIEGNGNHVVMNDDTVISTSGFDSHGIAVNGDGNIVDLNDRATITTGSGSAQGIYLGGSDNAVNMGGASSIAVSDFAVYGIYADGNDNTITIGDDATITANGQSSSGVYLYGIGNALDMTGGTISTTGNFGWGVRLDEHGNTVAMSGTSSIETSGYYANGITAYGGGNTITMTDEASIETQQSYARGIYLFGDEDEVELGGSSTVTTHGLGADGIRVEGDRTTIELSEEASITTTGFAGVGVYIIGDDGSLALTGKARIEAQNGDAVAIEGNGVHVSLGDEATITGNFNGIRVVGDDGLFEISGNAKLSGTYDGATAIIMSGNGGEIRASGHASIEGSVVIQGAGDISLSDDTSLHADSNGTVGIALNSGTVALHGRSSISMAGDDGTAIRVGGGTAIALDRGASIVMTGENATGILGQWGVQTVSIAGTLSIANGKAVDLGDGDDALTLETGAHVTGVVDGGDDTDSLTFEGEGTASADFVNFESLTVDATGIWNLTGDVTLVGAGTTAVNSGIFRVNGSLASPGGVTVASGATLGGTGTITGDVVNNGTIAPGNSPGTLTIIGDVAFNSGSIFHVEITPTAADLLDVQGAVAIDGGTIVTDLQDGVDGGAFTVLTATDGITGRFAAADGMGYIYGANSITLLVASPSTADAAFRGGANAGLAFLDAVLGQAGQGRGLWATGIYADDRREAFGASSGFEQTTRGVAMGGDVWTDDRLSVGVAAGYLAADADVAGRAGGADIDAWQAALYANCQCGFLFANGVLFGGYQNQETSRRVAAGTGVETARAKPSLWNYGAALKAGHVFQLEKSWAFIPSANLAWQQIDSGAYAETGGGLASLSLDEQRAGVLRAGIEGKLALSVRDPLETWTLTPSLHAGLGREWWSGDTRATGSFAGGASYTATLDRRDQSMVVAGGGLDFAMGAGVAIYARYDGRFGDIADRDLVTAGLRLSW